MSWKKTATIYTHVLDSGRIVSVDPDRFVRYTTVRKQCAYYLLYQMTNINSRVGILLATKY